MSYGSVESQASYVSLYGDTMQGSLNMNGNKLTGLPLATEGSDAVSVAYLNNRQVNGGLSWEVIGSDTIRTATEISVEKGFNFYNKILIHVQTSSLVSGSLSVKVDKSENSTLTATNTIARNSTAYLCLIPFFQNVIVGLPYGYNSDNYPRTGVADGNTIYLNGNFNGGTPVTVYGQVFK